MEPSAQKQRTRAEIDQEYGVIAAMYGDRLFKVTLLNNEIKTLFEKMASLNQEAGQVQGLVPVPELKEVPKEESSSPEGAQG